MKTYDVKCPVCGRINYRLYLEETDGWMECERCGSDIRVQNSNYQSLIPVYAPMTVEPVFISTV